MNKIENVECFENCTKLCKPHESNKAMWEIHETLDKKTEKKHKNRKTEKQKNRKTEN